MSNPQQNEIKNQIDQIKREREREIYCKMNLSDPKKTKFIAKQTKANRKNANQKKTRCTKANRKNAIYISKTKYRK